MRRPTMPNKPKSEKTSTRVSGAIVDGKPVHVAFPIDRVNEFIANAGKSAFEKIKELVIHDGNYAGDTKSRRKK
jgi:hypothetical protein